MYSVVSKCSQCGAPLYSPVCSCARFAAQDFVYPYALVDKEVIESPYKDLLHKNKLITAALSEIDEYLNTHDHQESCYIVTSFEDSERTCNCVLATLQSLKRVLESD